MSRSLGKVDGNVGGKTVRLDTTAHRPSFAKLTLHSTPRDRRRSSNLSEKGDGTEFDRIYDVIREESERDDNRDADKSQRPQSVQDKAQPESQVADEGSLCVQAGWETGAKKGLLQPRVVALIAQPESIAEAHSIPNPTSIVCNDENAPPPLFGVKPPRPGLVKSRTMNVFNNISQSLSRTTLASSRTRRPSNSGVSRSSLESESWTRPVFGKKSGDRAQRVPSNASSVSSCNFVRQPSDPRFVTQAQPSAYWSGRFSSACDHDNNQVLEAENLHIVVQSLSVTHLLPKENGPVTAAPNPSNSAYATSRVPHRLGSGGVFPSEPNSPVSATRIPTSRTTGAILERATAPRIPISSDSAMILDALSQLDSTRGPARTHHAQPKGPLTTPKLFSPILRSPILRGPMSWKKQPSRSEQKAAHGRTESMDRMAILAKASDLQDDDRRCLRVFAELEACCLTPAARASLRSWQQSYARRYGKPLLLPPGGTIHGQAFMDNGSYRRKSTSAFVKKMLEKGGVASRQLAVRAAEEARRRVSGGLSEASLAHDHVESTGLASLAKSTTNFVSAIHFPTRHRAAGSSTDITVVSHSDGSEAAEIMWGAKGADLGEEDVPMAGRKMAALAPRPRFAVTSRPRASVDNVTSDGEPSKTRKKRFTIL